MSKKGLLITEEEKKLILKLHGLISEGDPMSRYGGGYTREELPSDYLGSGRAFEKNYTPTQDKTNPNTAANQYAKQQEIKRDYEKKVNLKDTFLNWKKDRNEWVDRIESGYKEYIDEEGKIKEGAPDWVTAAKNIADEKIKKSEAQTEKSNLTQTFNMMFESLPNDITYVKTDGTKFQINKADYEKIPKGWNPKQWGVEYGGTPPNSLVDPITGNEIFLTIPNDYQKTGNPEFDSKYKIYFSPYEIMENYKNQFVNAGVSYTKTASSFETAEDVLKSPIVARLYTKEQIEKSLTECESMAKAFLMKVSKLQIKDSKGRTVGLYRTDDRGQKELVRWDGGILGNRKDSIPCDNQFWEDYGPAIQVGVILLATIVTAGLGGPAAVAAVTADIAGNAAAMYFDAQKQDADTVVMDAGFVLLAPLFEIPGVKMGLKRLAAGKKLLPQFESVMSKIKASAGMSPDDVKTMINSMTDEEKAVLALIGDSRMEKIMKEGAIDISKQYKQFIGARKILPTSIEIASNGIPIGALLLKKYVDSVKQTLSQPTQNELTTWSIILSNLMKSEADLLVQLMEKITNGQTNGEFLTNSSQFKAVEQQVTDTKLGIKPNTSMQDIKSDEQNFANKLKEMKEKINQRAKEQNMPPPISNTEGLNPNSEIGQDVKNAIKSKGPGDK